jgi:hypothetical protein
VRRWYRKLADCVELRLIDAMSLSGRVPRGPSAQRLDPVVRGFVEAAARYYYACDGYKITDAFAYFHDLLSRENTDRRDRGSMLPQLDGVSRSTLSRAIRRIRCFDTLAEKKGRAWARRHFKVSGEGSTLSAHCRLF